MIDIENKVIKFGYGDVQIGFSLNMLIFTWLKTPVEVGSPINKDMNIELLSEPIKFEFNEIEELAKFKRLVESINENNLLFTYKDYTFDYSKYNKESINVLLNNIQRLLNVLIIPTAC